MNGFLRFCAVVGTLILVGMGLLVLATAATLVVLSVSGLNPYA